MSVFVWTDVDLDGAGAALMFDWIFKKPVPFKATTVRKFSGEFTSWYGANKDLYSNIFICDLDTGPFIDIVDRPGITIIDHHESHLLNKSRYVNAKSLIKKYTSSTKLIVDKFNIELSGSQRRLVNIIDDYDSYKLEYPESLDLNRVLWGLTGNRVQKFKDAFNSGFSGFNDQHQNIINLFKKKLQDTISSLDIHIGTIKIGGSDQKIVSTIADFGINEVANTIISIYDADIGIVVNPTSSTVSFRRAKKCNIAMNDLAAKLANGGGHKESAGGSITETFMNFCKALQHV